MTEWEVWRTDDNGVRCLVATYSDRIEALARILVFESGHPHKQTYDIVGERGPSIRTNRDLYLSLVRLGAQVARGDRALLDYLCALWSVSRSLARYETLDADTTAAMLHAAATAPPVRPEPAWRTADFSVQGEYSGFADFTKVLCTQIADLLAFQEQPPGPYAAFGVEAPPRLDGGRATVELWCNFDPATYLECAAAGSFGGWNTDDGHRIALHDIAGDLVVALPTVTWGDLGAFLEYGQSYE